MRMGEVGIGLGAGIKDFRAVFVFHDRAALERFLDVGISIGGKLTLQQKQVIWVPQLAAKLS